MTPYDDIKAETCLRQEEAALWHRWSVASRKAGFLLQSATYQKLADDCSVLAMDNLDKLADMDKLLIFAFRLRDLTKLMYESMDQGGNHTIRVNPTMAGDVLGASVLALLSSKGFVVQSIDRLKVKVR